MKTMKMIFYLGISQLMTKPQLIAYLYEFALWLEDYEIEIEETEDDVEEE